MLKVNLYEVVIKVKCGERSVSWDFPNVVAADPNAARRIAIDSGVEQGLVVKTAIIHSYAYEKDTDVLCNPEELMGIDFALGAIADSRTDNMPF